MEIGVIGQSEFTLGFRLAGIRKVVDMRNADEFGDMMEEQSVGIVITDKNTLDALPEHERERALKSVKPVVVVVSDAAQEELRAMIIRSIGVDLLQQER